LFRCRQFFRRPVREPFQVPGRDPDRRAQQRRGERKPRKKKTEDASLDVNPFLPGGDPEANACSVEKL
jgi:hypothetical protein